MVTEIPLLIQAQELAARLETLAEGLAMAHAQCADARELAADMTVITPSLSEQEQRLECVHRGLVAIRLQIENLQRIIPRKGWDCR